jgi:hypothetical protein
MLRIAPESIVYFVAYRGILSGNIPARLPRTWGWWDHGNLLQTKYGRAKDAGKMSASCHFY